MKVRFLADRLPVGGAERVVQALCTGLPELGIETSLSTFRGLGAIGEEIAAAGVPVNPSVLPHPRLPSSLPRLVGHLRSDSPDIVYVLDHSNALFLGRLAARLAGVPRQLCAIHRTRRADGSPSLGFLDRWLMPLSDAVVAVSVGQAEYLRDEEGIAPEHIVVIHNGIDARSFPPRREGEELAEARRRLQLPPKVPVVAVVAALRPEKNHALLLRALAGCRCRPQPHLLVIGGGSEEERIRRAAEKEGVARRVHWLGIRRNIPELLSLADVVALSSSPVVETFPLCILEAMAASLPVVATRVGSLQEMVVDQETGILVDPGDADAFARALERVLEQPERARAMGKAGRERVLRNFDRRSMVEKTARLLRQLAVR